MCLFEFVVCTIVDCNTVDPQLSEPRLSELSLIRTPLFGNYNDIHWNFAVH